MYYNNRQNYLQPWLALGELAYNTSITTIYNYSLYYTLYGFKPLTFYHNKDFKFSSLTSKRFLDSIMTVHNQVHNALEQSIHKCSAINVNKGDKFNSEGWVCVDRQNLQINLITIVLPLIMAWDPLKSEQLLVHMLIRWKFWRAWDSTMSFTEHCLRHFNKCMRDMR